MWPRNSGIIRQCRLEGTTEARAGPSLSSRSGRWCPSSRWYRVHLEGETPGGEPRFKASAQDSYPEAQILLSVTSPTPDKWRNVFTNIFNRTMAPDYLNATTFFYPLKGENSNSFLDEELE